MITLVYDSYGDWVAIYSDGKLLEQSHSFREDDVLRILGLEHEVLMDVPWVGENNDGFSDYPEDLSKVREFLENSSSIDQ